VFEYLEAGAFGYLPTPYPADELIRAIWTVHEGGAVLDIPAAIAVVEHFRARGAVLDCLTERERQVLICMCEGLSGDEVVEKFGFTKETLRTHVRNVLGKLGAHSAAQAVALYLNPKAQMATPGTHHLPSEVEHNRFVPAGNICRFPSQSPVIDAPLSLRSSPKQKFINLEK
jgi:DNA-binding CsgD family transcriptional regulator